ncbi:MAG: hypothetical protein IAA89_00555 [Firmicutes bacterium]|uniref:Uncharacterized protein n=1 Tax=Candidatus Gallilactobacillus intestinavium TaxID=2840838 RepID=A0A9D9E4D4_9LACO|nr:hypothetical protein [Candidatus Gallilactobacillus intestinavium]
MLKNVSKDKKILTNHLWLNYCKSFLKLGKLHKGDIIQFDARVDDYYKGYWLQKQHDYKLSYPTKVSLLNSNHQFEELPINDNHALIGYILNDNKKFYKSTMRGTTDDDFYKDAYNQWQKQYK